MLTFTPKVSSKGDAPRMEPWRFVGIISLARTIASSHVKDLMLSISFHQDLQVKHKGLLRLLGYQKSKMDVNNLDVVR